MLILLITFLLIQMNTALHGNNGKRNAFSSVHAEMCQQNSGCVETENQGEIQIIFWIRLLQYGAFAAFLLP
jgi:hypothetical protein